MQDYFDNLYEAIKEFDKFNKENAMTTQEEFDAAYPVAEEPRVIKPLYMLIKVDVDPEIVYNHAKAHTYAQNHCDRLEYELVDYLYPNEEYTPKPHYPFIKL